MHVSQNSLMGVRHDVYGYVCILASKTTSKSCLQLKNLHASVHFPIQKVCRGVFCLKYRQDLLAGLLP